MRPVSIACRVGAHSAVVWKRLNFRPPAASRSAVGVLHGTPERAGRTEAHVVEQDDQDVRGTSRWRQRLDGRVRRVRVLRVVRRQAGARLVGNRQHRSGRSWWLMGVVLTERYVDGDGRSVAHPQYVVRRRGRPPPTRVIDAGARSRLVARCPAGWGGTPARAACPLRPPPAAPTTALPSPAMSRFGLSPAVAANRIPFTMSADPPRRQPGQGARQPVQHRAQHGVDQAEDQGDRRGRSRARRARRSPAPRRSRSRRPRS